MSEDNKTRRVAAASAFKDILGELRNQDPAAAQETTLDGKTLAKLLEKNFKALDPNGNGITKEELARAMLMPQRFTNDEFIMIKMLGRYFDTISNLSNDEQGKDILITVRDMEVLSQFLLYTDLSLEQLDSWIALGPQSE